MEIGYASASALVPTMDAQIEALTQAGCAGIFTDTLSGVKAKRTGLAEARALLAPGDTFVVWRLDRLGRTLPQLLEMVEDLRACGIGFKSLTERIDTTASTAEHLFPVFQALAELERNLIRERIQAGLITARSRGGVRGRPHALDTEQIVEVRRLYADKAHSIQDICCIFQISRMTLWRYLREPQEIAGAPGTPAESGAQQRIG